jgi:hypothetical protein
MPAHLATKQPPSNAISSSNSNSNNDTKNFYKPASRSEHQQLQQDAKARELLQKKKQAQAQGAGQAGPIQERWPTRGDGDHGGWDRVEYNFDYGATAEHDRKEKDLRKVKRREQVEEAKERAEPRDRRERIVAAEMGVERSKGSPKMERMEKAIKSNPEKYEIGDGDSDDEIEHSRSFPDAFRANNFACSELNVGNSNKIGLTGIGTGKEGKTGLRGEKKAIETLPRYEKTSARHRSDELNGSAWEGGKEKSARNRMQAGRAHADENQGYDNEDENRRMRIREDLIEISMIILFYFTYLLFCFASTILFSFEEQELLDIDRRQFELERRKFTLEKELEELD